MRVGLRVRGVVQGVGFRPLVHKLARELALAGEVRNDDAGVWIELEGERPSIERFTQRLRAERPPLSTIASIEEQHLEPRGSREFVIVHSVSGARASTAIPADAAPCADCLRELSDPRDRRYRYPFINCTACGPRFSIVFDVPYDRARTTMRGFTMCAACRGEYEDPSDRRFHAEPNACPACGPKLRWTGGDEDPLTAAVRALEAGLVVAVKGVGGFQLAVRADDDAAVARLRARKRRPHKPLAVMARDLEQVRRIARVDDTEHLTSATRPIVLFPLRDDARIARAIAPGLREVGVMLPASPLHHLLLAEGPALLVMTSGNYVDEPIAKDDDDALARLREIADHFLLHDRPIHTRVDDSVVRGRQPVRNARGIVPASIALGEKTPPILAVGADLKNAVCVVRGGEAYLSQHIGDLAEERAYEFFLETIEKMGRLLDVAPAVVAHDLHPEYRSTRYALERGLQCIAVQHHHAHVVSCLAEHGREGPAIGVAFDGTGCGPEGDLWGGEVLVFDRQRFERCAHLRALPLPGGEAAIREPWRIGIAARLDAGLLPAFEHIDGSRRRIVEQMIVRGVGTPRATGAGRWFDAVAAMIGLRDAISYEGQAAIELEAIAATGAVDPYPFELRGSEIDLRPMVRAIATERSDASVVSARFHETLARAIAATCTRLRDARGLELVALSGGCFQNRLLTERVVGLLPGFEVLVHRRVPPNDGGIALGQAAVAAARLQGRS